MSNKRDRNMPQDSHEIPSLFDARTMMDLLAEVPDDESTAKQITFDKTNPTKTVHESVVTLKPTLDEWRRLYDAAVLFRDLAPWGWMFEDQLFSVINPEDGEVGYCCVMGSGGEFPALGVYRGEVGLSSYKRMSRRERYGEDAGVPSAFEVYVNQKVLMASFEGREDVDKRDREVFQSLGLRFRGRHAWPILRSHEPGYVRWFLTAQECRFLTNALEQAALVARRVEENPDILNKAPGWVLTRVGHYTGETIQWDDAWRTLPDVENAIAEEAIQPPVPVDEIRVKHAMSTGKTSGAWEVDISYAPYPVNEGDRPYFPRMMLCVHHGSGMILTLHPAEHEDDPSEFVEQIVSIIEQHGIYPDQIVVRRRSVAQLLMPVAQVLGAEVLVTGALPGIEMVRDSMHELME